MYLGKLKHRITIEEYTKTYNDHGQAIKKWQPKCKAWAQVQSISGKEYMAQNIELSQVSWRIYTRNIDITNKNRIVFNNKILSISAVLQNNDQTILTILCEDNKE